MRAFLSGFKEGFIGFSSGVAHIVNIILLSIVYFIGFGLTSIAGKIAGKKFLEMEKKKDTYWVEHVVEKQKIEESKRSY